MREIDARQEMALRAVFEPLAKLLLKQNLPAKPVLEIFRCAFVKGATEDYGRNDKPASMSEVARRTGLTRKEVRRIRDQIEEQGSHTDAYGPSESEVLHYWYSETEFLNKDGAPRALDPGPGPGTFHDLVDKTSCEEPALDLLARLESSGAVVVDSDGQIRLSRRDYLIGGDFPKLLAISLAPLADTMNKNWGKPPSEGLCQRMAHSRSVDPKKIDKFRRIARDRIVSFLEEIDDFLIDAETDEDVPFFDRDGVELHRIGVGAFYFEVDK